MEAVHASIGADFFAAFRWRTYTPGWNSVQLNRAGDGPHELELDAALSPASSPTLL